MKGERIEAVMIVKNEEEVLGRCLASLQGIDKVTILDTGSADGTAAVAARFGADIHVGKYRWCDDFAHARNEALKYATCEWVLIIDADEILAGDGPDGSMAALRRAVDAAGPEDRAFVFRCFDSSGKHEHRVVRCHRRLPDIVWRGAIHNYLSQQDGRLADGVILVYGHSPAHNNDPDRAFRILSREVALNPAAGRETYYLAREYFSRGKFPEAIKLYTRYLPLSIYPPEAADAHIMLARANLLTGNGEAAWQHLFNALRVNADVAEAYAMLAKLSGPANCAHWLRNAENAGNTRCLFIRPADDMVVEECSATAPGAMEVSAPHEIEGMAQCDDNDKGKPVVFNHVPVEKADQPPAKPKATATRKRRAKK